MQREAKMVPGSAAAIAAASASKTSAKESRLPVTQWSKLDATPYGALERLQSREDAGKAKSRPVSTTALRVLGDHYAQE